tara:strand:- start:712 stop:1587 length:876 start_codon:yes stop_codon:yes gene_type:complete
MNDVVCWWSGGVTSAYACYLSINLFGLDRCHFLMIDTKNEHKDTYRFKKDCEKLYGKKINIITEVGNKYSSIEDVWIKNMSLNVSYGAICSYELKRKARENWEKKNKFSHQVFGFEFESKEFNRALSLSLNHKKVNAIFPLLMYGYNKDKCIDFFNDKKIEIPMMYKLGFRNNNCFKTGCVQGGIGYWKKIQKDFPKIFNKMAKIEHQITNDKKKPVTMLKDQSNLAKGKNNQLVFLKKHPDYPQNKSIDDMKGREVKPLMECNGFCGTNDLNPLNKTEDELNYQITMFKK